MDAARPRAQALAVRDGRILAVGEDADIRAMANGRTRMIDAGGRLVMPGFQDTHIHLQDSGTDLSMSVDLSGATTIEELQGLLRRFATDRPNEPWVRGTGWYSGIFGAHNLTREVLDAAVPDRPLYIFASDGHNAALNSKGCEAVGLTASTPDPDNGTFVRDAKGVPTGLLYEHAIFPVVERMPQPDDDTYRAGVRYAQKHANEHGITGILDALVQERHMRVYSSLDKAGELSVRVRATALVEPHDTVEGALARTEQMRRDYRSELCAVHSAKFFLDGVLENRTGLMIEDYADAEGGNAKLMFDKDLLHRLFKAFDAARFQIHVHVIGDGAARVALDALEDARAVNGAWPSLHQLAHVQMIDPADIPRFRDLGVVANIQPLWARHEASTDLGLAMVGPKRGRWMYPWRTIIDSGAHYAVSSDWAVSTLNPFAIMQVAVTRQSEKRGRNTPVFFPEERLDVETVVRGYTVNAAAAAWRAGETGSLVAGKQADLIVVDRDVFAIDPYEIGGTEVLLTMLAGREVHRAKGFDG